MPEGNAEFLQLRIGEQTQGFEVNVILGEDRGVTLQPKFLEPGRQSVHVVAILRRFRMLLCDILDPNRESPKWHSDLARST